MLQKPHRKGRMISRYKTISIIYGGSGGIYAKNLNESINEYEKENRYPLSSRIVMESILTGDILEKVTQLFSETEICIAILTADDCCIKNNKNVLRLRQNVVFELGMALYKLGREHCILLGDFEDKADCVELPSDMNGLDIRFFNDQTQTQVFNDVIKKILQLSRTSKDENEEFSQYDNLLRRETYFVNYGKLFYLYDKNHTGNNKEYLQNLLDVWLDECKSLNYFDERLMYIAERVAFLPIFGKQDAVSNWYTKIEKILGDYKEKDRQYYGNCKLLDFGKNTLSVVISYIKQKMVDSCKPTQSTYEELLVNLKLNPPPKGEKVNPLLEVLYYDYIGLTMMHLYSYSPSFDKLLATKECYEKIVNEYLDKVDLGLNVWGGFLYYNIARLYSKMLEHQESDISSEDVIRAYLQAITIRKKWLSGTSFNSMVQNALSYEYFIAKLDYIHQMQVMNLKTPDDIENEYCKVEGEIESYCNEDEKLERLLYVQDKLRKLRSER